MEDLFSVDCEVGFILRLSVAWVGGGIFYLFVLRPALRRSGDGGREVNRYAAAEFKVLVDICFFLIVVTGISLTFDRLSGGVAGVWYVVVSGGEGVRLACGCSCWRRGGGGGRS